MSFYGDLNTKHLCLIFKIRGRSPQRQLESMGMTWCNGGRVKY
jgi:hypothetical protein